MPSKFVMKDLYTELSDATTESYYKKLKSVKQLHINCIELYSICILIQLVIFPFDSFQIAIENSVNNNSMTSFFYIIQNSHSD